MVAFLVANPRMLSLPIYLRGNTYYLHIRWLGRQVKRSLHTADKATAIIKASELLKAFQMAIDLTKIRKYELDIAKGIARADSPEDHLRLLETMQMMTLLNNLNSQAKSKSAPPATDSPPSQSQQEAQGLTLLEVLDKFFLFRKVRPATVISYRNAVEEFAGFVGKKRKATSIGQSDITLFQEHLLKKGNTHRTVDNKVNALRALFFFAIKQGYFFGDNPAANRDLLSKKEREGSGSAFFEEEEIRSIFLSDYMVHQKKRDPDYYWAVVLALVTGCRISEITSLNAEQFKTSPKGTFYVSIKDSKTKAGIRDIPLPSGLMGMGLKEFLPEKGAVFQYQTRDGRGSGNAVGKKFGRHLLDIGITRDKLTLHSLRKFLNNLCLHSDVPYEPRCQFIGHEIGHVNVSTYGKKFTVDELAIKVAPVLEKLMELVAGCPR